jgi:hypothetical protein
VNNRLSTGYEKRYPIAKLLRIDLFFLVWLSAIVLLLLTADPAGRFVAAAILFLMAPLYFLRRAAAIVGPNAVRFSGLFAVSIAFDEISSVQSLSWPLHDKLRFVPGPSLQKHFALIRLRRPRILPIHPQVPVPTFGREFRVMIEENQLEEFVADIVRRIQA